jgi:hypothetical protein
MNSAAVNARHLSVRHEEVCPECITAAIDARRNRPCRPGLNQKLARNRWKRRNTMGEQCEGLGWSDVADQHGRRWDPCAYDLELTVLMEAASGSACGC